MMIRLFIALKLPEEIVKEMVLLRNSACEIASEPVSGFRWEPEEKLHLTLKFLGDTEESKLPEIVKILSRISEDFKAVSLEFDRFGFFLPRILWFGLHAENALFDLVKRLNYDLQNLGFEPENRNFKPHITLLRIKHEVNPEFVSAFKNFKLPHRKFQAEEIALIKSELHPRGSIYSELQCFNLLQSEE
ncbi:MAG: RNA 2',3'-cyclic phosphodiesterase [Bacillota bacterium]